MELQWSQTLYTQCSVRTFHKYGFDKDLESHGRGREVSGAWLDTFAGLLVPTGDRGGGAEVVFLVFLVLATQSQRHNC